MCGPQAIFIVSNRKPVCQTEQHNIRNRVILSSLLVYASVVEYLAVVIRHWVASPFLYDKSLLFTQALVCFLIDFYCSLELDTMSESCRVANGVSTYSAIFALASICCLIHTRASSTHALNTLNVRVYLTVG